MAVVTISRGSYSRGKEIAEKTAQRLGYKCISREFLLEASKEFNVSEIKLIRTFEDVPSILDRFTYGKEKYVAFIKATLLKQLAKDKVVYHGFAGHLFVKDICHVLKVRIISPVEDRMRIVMERDKMPMKEALGFILKVDEQRRRWARRLYGVDLWDPNLYDLVLNIGRITIDDAVDAICGFARLKQFQTTKNSRKMVTDLALAAEVSTLLVGVRPATEVFAENGLVYLKTDVPVSQDSELVRKMGQIVKTVPGVKGIKVVGEKISAKGPPRPSKEDIELTKDKLRTFFNDL